MSTVSQSVNHAVNHIVLINCSDEKGLIAKITKIMFDHSLNIIAMNEHVDETSDEGKSHFYMRCDFTGSADIMKLQKSLVAQLPKDAEVVINPRKKKDILIFASKEYHCLSDLLIRHFFGELNAEIRAVVSNHEVLKDIVSKFGIPFHFVPHEGKNKEEYEKQISEITARYQPDFIVLAKYMRILPPEFVARFQNRIINIHHSFLPAFIGANPYRQAFERGIKLIGATAHFVTDKLDEGPIITQKTNNVDHSYSVEDMRKSGKEIERVVLSEALQFVFEDRIFVTGNKTIIFD